MTVGEMAANWSSSLSPLLLTRYGLEPSCSSPSASSARSALQASLESRVDEGTVEWSSLLGELSCIEEAEGYVYVHVPTNYPVPKRLLTEVLGACDVVDGGSLADAAEFMVHDVGEEEGEEGVGGVRFQVVGADVGEVEEAVKDARNFPARFYYAGGVEGRGRAEGNPFVTVVEGEGVERLIMGEEL